MKRSKMKLSNEAKFRLAVHTALLAGVSTAVMPVSAQEAAADEKATELEAVEVTGSRLGRADIEGALPVATITREDIDRSGFTSVAELLRNTTFNSLGAFRAQSGSSAQALVAVDLRGLGSERTLVLIDGRRAPKAPFAPSAQDLNAVPIAMVERIEVLKDGASAIYGSDAIAGVINIITRKDYSGAAVTYQKQGTDRPGGDSHGGQLVGGLTGDRGSVVMGASFFSRDIIFARDSILAERGASLFSNNYILTVFTDANADGLHDGPGNATGVRRIAAVPGGCPNADPGFYLRPNGRCGYDFNLVAADEAQTNNQGVFVRSDYKINDSWKLDVNGSVSRATSFGRYAPALNDNPILVPASSPNNAYGDQDVYLYHRFAALGTRDNNTDANVYDLSGAFSGTVGDLDVSVGARHNEYQYYELGKNYVVLPIASQLITSGIDLDQDGTLEFYDIYDPTVNNAPEVLNAMKATITRDSIWRTLEYFAEAKLPLFSMGGGTAATAFGIEYRTEKYFDAYDSLQEAGQIGGTAGNSAGTDRKVKSAYAELFMPVLDTLEVSLSGRFEDYNDVGNNFAPKLSGRFQPMDNMTLRASIGQGFRAPTLDVISALPTYSAESINNDQATCEFSGFIWDPVAQQCDTQVQVSTTIISNPQLQAEESDQYSVGFAMDITESIDFSIDYYNISLTDRINFISPQEIIDRLTTGDPIPAGLGVVRDPLPSPPPPEGNRIINVIAGSANEGDLDTSGLDVAFNLKQGLGGLGMLETNLIGTYILEYKIDNGRDLTGDPAVPQYRATLGNSWKLAQMSLQLNGNHIADQAQTVTAGGTQRGHIPSYTTWDVQFGYELPLLGGAELAVGAINIFGREPSGKSSFDGRDYNFYLYDQYGTQPYVKFTQKF
jgi:iron complex outermembrane receptor protein